MGTTHRSEATDRRGTAPPTRGRSERSPLRSRSLGIRSALLVVAALALLAGCTQDIERVSGPRTGEPTQSDIRLVRAETCDQLVAAAEAREQIARDRMERLEGDGQDAVAFDEGATGSGAAGGAERSPGASMPATTMAPSPVAAPAAGPTDADPAAASDQSTTPKGDDTSGAPVIAGTNNQEQGVDEGDMVKTDGRLLVTLTGDGVLRVVVLDDSPTVDGQLTLSGTGSAQPSHMYGMTTGQLLLRGDEVVAVQVAWDGRGMPITDITRVDLSDPSTPRVTERARVAGELAATRMIGRTIRIVVRPSLGTPIEPMPTPMPEPPMPPETTVPEPTTTTTTTTTATSTSTTTTTGTDPAEIPAAAARLMPQLVGDDGTARPLGGCQDVLSAPMVEPAGDTASGSASGSMDAADSEMAMPTTAGVTVLTVGDTLGDLAPVTVDGGVESVYAGTDALYTTSTVWGGPTGEMTAVHRFDLTGEGAARYTGSGLVPGMLLNQYSMSDRGGALRIVTTATTMVPAAPAATSTVLPSPRPTAIPVEPGTAVEPDGSAVSPAEPGIAADVVGPMTTSAGRLAVLRPADDGMLREVGHLDDLGVGEQVKAVRFLGDRAYVVTFRQTDPLFAVDLTDDTAPRLLGELKIPGFSEYLHPIGDGRLLGIGSDADATTGRVTGFKASLFDVTDPTAPKELDALVAPDMTSPVGQDPHTFTWDPTRSQAIVPVMSYGVADEGAVPPMGECPEGAACAMPAVRVDESAGVDQAARPWSGAWVLGVDGDRIVRRGSIAHDLGPAAADILRSVVVGDSIWTVSDRAVGRTPAAAPDGVTLIRF